MTAPAPLEPSGDEAAGIRSGVTGIVLCGGRGRRLQGADKPLLHWRGETLVAQVLRRLRPQVKRIIISANRNLDTYGRLAPVVADALPGYQGPLAGIAAALGNCPTPWAVVCPGDAPLIPADLVERLVAALGHPSTVGGLVAGTGPSLAPNSPHPTDPRLGCRGAASSEPLSAAFSRVGQRRHYLHCLLRQDVAEHLQRHLAAGHQDAKSWLEALNAAEADFPGQEDAFRNFNEARDFAESSE